MKIKWRKFVYPDSKLKLAYSMDEYNDEYFG